MPQITIRSPLDGTVTAVPAIGDEFAAGVSPALVGFEHQRPGVGLRPVYDLGGLTPQAANMLFRVRSDLLELQLEEEKKKLEFAEKKLGYLKELQKIDLGVRPDNADGMAGKDLKRVQLRSRAEWIFWRNIGNGIAIDKSGMQQVHKDELHGYFQPLPTLEVEVGQARFESTKLDWQIKLETADEEILSARRSIKNTEFQLSVGEVFCSQPVRVKAVHVMEFQAVTRGDPIVDVITVPA